MLKYSMKEKELERELERDKAYYHLPGLFEFYELYRVFLPLFREHREYFYDWCEIGSIYGAPWDCLWGGGRVECGDSRPQEVLELMQEYGISARLTFSNSLLKEEHLSDKRCNAHYCSAPNAGEGYRFSKAMTNPGFIGLEDIRNVYLPMGFSNFKIEGRGLGSALVLEFLLYYMTKPEYQIHVREAIYLDNMLDIF